MAQKFDACNHWRRVVNWSLATVICFQMRPFLMVQISCLVTLNRRAKVRGGSEDLKISATCSSDNLRGPDLQRLRFLYVTR